MSAIAACLNFDDRPADRRVVARMLASAAHRGSRMTVWSDGAVALGVGVPEGDGSERLLSTADGYALAFDGRLDNRGEILRALPAEARAAAAGGDASLLLAAYRTWGTAAFSRILGDFAVVLWDASRRCLVCARDVAGVKPLCYHAGPRTFVCGSELQQLFQGAEIPAAVNEGMLAEHLCLRVSHAEDTLYRGVLRLPPAHTLTASADRVATARYYDLDPGLEIPCGDSADYAEQFRALLEEAIRCRIDEGAPMAAYLSGGLDSSSVVSLYEQMRRTGQAPDVPLHTLSIFTPGFPGDESHFFRQVARHWNLQSHEFEAPVVDPATFAGHVSRHRDLPEPATVAAADVMLRYARSLGCRVVLTGLGGDDWLSTYATHATTLLTQGRIREFVAHVRSGDEFTPATTLLRAALAQGVWPTLPYAVRDLVNRLRGRSELPDYLTPELARVSSITDRQRPVRHRGCRTRAQQEIRDWLADGGLSDGHEMDDRHHAEFGIEARHPFCDRRLIEFAFALPDEWRWRGAQTKFVLREAMNGLLPNEVRARTTKGDYSSILVTALERCGGESCFASLELARRGWVRADRLLEMYRRMRERFERRDPLYVWDTLPLWTVYGVELWLRQSGG